MIKTFIKQKDPKTGKPVIVINPLKHFVNNYWLNPLQRIQQTIALPGAPTPVQVIYEVDNQGHFDIRDLMAIADDTNVLVKIFDPGLSRNWSNDYVHMDTITGTALQPYILPETYMLNTGRGPRSLILEFINLSGQDNNVRFVMAGRRFFRKEANCEVQKEMDAKFINRERLAVYFLTPQQIERQPGAPAGLQKSAIWLPGGGALTDEQAPKFIATNNADTELFKASYFSTGPFEFKLTQLSNNRTIMNDWVQVTEGWGNGRFPYVFPESFLIERNQEVGVQVRDLSGQDNTIYLTLAGRRMYYLDTF